MTEQECANNLDNLHKKIVRNYEIASKVTEKEVMSLVRAKKLLEELEQIKALQDDYWKLNEMCKYYSALGTVEELRVARDKQVAKKLTHEATLHWCPTCPSCKNVLSEFMKFNDEKLLDATKHCKFCGQKLDWSDEDDNC